MSSGLDLSGGLDSEIAHMAADDGDGATVQNHPGPHGDTLIDGVAKPERGGVLGPVFADSRYAREQTQTGVPG